MAAKILNGDITGIYAYAIAEIPHVLRLANTGGDDALAGDVFSRQPRITQVVIDDQGEELELYYSSKVDEDGDAESEWDQENSKICETGAHKFQDAEKLPTTKLWPSFTINDAHYQFGDKDELLDIEVYGQQSLDSETTTIAIKHNFSAKYSPYTVPEFSLSLPHLLFEPSDLLTTIKTFQTNIIVDKIPAPSTPDYTFSSIATTISGSSYPLNTAPYVHIPQPSHTLYCHASHNFPHRLLFQVSYMPRPTCHLPLFISCPQ